MNYRLYRHYLQVQKLTQFTSTKIEIHSLAFFFKLLIYICILHYTIEITAWTTISWFALFTNIHEDVHTNYVELKLHFLQMQPGLQYFMNYPITKF